MSDKDRRWCDGCNYCRSIRSRNGDWNDRVRENGEKRFAGAVVDL